MGRMSNDGRCVLIHCRFCQNMSAVCEVAAFLFIDKEGCRQFIAVCKSDLLETFIKSNQSVT